jgi:hypothetical protein
LDEVSCLRDLNHQHIDIIIARRRQWREISLQRWTNTPVNNNVLSHKVRDISDDNVTNLHTLTDVLLRSRADFKLVTSVSQAWIYTNDLELFDQLDQLDFLMWCQYTQAKINRPKNTISLRNPQHKHRSYFRSIKLTDLEKQQLCNFFNNQTEIRISSSLSKWMNDRWHRTQDYFFIDHNEESWLVMLSLIKPGLIRKTLELITA